MSPKPVRLRAPALQDVENAIDFYRREAGSQVALRFVDALAASYKFIATHPAAPSALYAHELNLPGLRSRLLRRFPYIIFYIEQDNAIDVWRVLHAQRDIPVWMSTGEGT